MSDMSYAMNAVQNPCGPVVFSSPHSGRDYQNTFGDTSILDAQTLRSSEDAFVDDLYDYAEDVRIPMIRAMAPRAFVDLNRSRMDLDPAVIEGHRTRGVNMRVNAGLGVIPRVVAHARPIYRGKISKTEAESRLCRIWDPYHTRLRGLLDRAHAQFAQAILIDCHSMPQDAIENMRTEHGHMPDIVIGDRYGRSADPALSLTVQRIFETAGFHVMRNAPFAGAYIAQCYGAPKHNRHVIQIEINRSLYMHEDTITKRRDFDALRRRLRPVIADLALLGRGADTLAAQ